MAGRPKIYDEALIIDKATNVFWEKCYDSASADELLDAMGIGKGSFYLAFKGGKQELYEKTLQRFSDTFYDKLASKVNNAENGIDVIKQFFYAMAKAGNEEKNRGCYLGNALVQLSEKDRNIRSLAANLLSRLQDLFTQAVKRAQANGQLKTKEDPALLGLHLSNLWNGIHVTRRMNNSPAALKQLVDFNLQLIQ
ncbi:TetR family transcriptional regulator [Chitinophaga skermanii]|uniref:TetR family transcriptional regulator n=1 Tax=Chitinophaga skermanii TaxID=331697 RepID=A0A327R4Q4_9BACT|nr:TetR/AcrR family transcriptional regulator [Chitinophaga skermanii]RAJ08867.1 TetR family transcriptional regulator [Chitinophaga skermanii]